MSGRRPVDGILNLRIGKRIQRSWPQSCSALQHTRGALVQRGRQGRGFQSLADSTQVDSMFLKAPPPSDHKAYHPQLEQTSHRAREGTERKSIKSVSRIDLSVFELVRYTIIGDSYLSMRCTYLSVELL